MRRKSPKVLAPTPEIPTKEGNHCVVVLPDLHFPEQDPIALEIVHRVIERLQPRKTVILGDWCDAKKFSTHPKKSLAESTAESFYEEEIKPCKKSLDRIGKNSQEIVYHEGNHEFRVERAAADSPVVAAVFDLISPKLLLSKGRDNFTWVPYASDGCTISHYKIANSLWSLHGITHSIHAAYTTLQKLRSVSCVFGHIHRKQQAATRDPRTGEVLQAWSPGCLSKLQPLWQHAHVTDWVHGFSIIFVKDDLTEWTAYSPTISNGQVVLPDGTTIKVD